MTGRRGPRSLSGRQADLHQVWANQTAMVLLLMVLLVVLAALLFGYRYSVPSLTRVPLYALALTGPVVLVPTVLLWRQAATGVTWNAAFGTALLGALAGLLCGWVYGLGVW